MLAIGAMALGWLIAHGPLAIAIWIVCATFSVGVLFTLGRFIVPRGAEVVLYRTHIRVPSLFGAPRDLQVREVEVDARGRQGVQQVEMNGQTISVPTTIVTEVRFASPTYRRV